MPSGAGNRTATLYVVATPIGNLEDLSARAVRVLREAKVVAAESIQRTKGLLAHLGIRGKQLISCREANRAKAAAKILGHLGSGEDVALVTDGGSPGVSDPGAWVVRRVAAEGYRITPVPGPSALVAALSVSGLEGGPVVFAGFLPHKRGPRRERLKELAATGWALVIFEAPHRLNETLQDMEDILGPERTVMVARELTKRYEQLLCTNLGELGDMARGGYEWQGEITLVVGPGSAPRARKIDASRLAQALKAAGVGASRAARIMAAATGMDRSDAYKLVTDLDDG